MPDAIEALAVLKPTTPAHSETSKDRLPREKLIATVRCLSLNWSALPAFGTRSLAPLAMLWFTPLQICTVLLVGSLLWYPVRSQFVSLRLAAILSVLNNILVCIAANTIVAIAFFLVGAYRDAWIALLWSIVATAISHVWPQKSQDAIEEKLLNQLTGRPCVAGTAPSVVFREQVSTT